MPNSDDTHAARPPAGELAARPPSSGIDSFPSQEMDPALERKLREVMLALAKQWADEGAPWFQPKPTRRSDPPFFTKLSVRVSPELSVMLQEMARDYGTTKEGAILKAIGLLRLAYDARREGKRVAIVDGDGEIDQEIEDV